VIHPSAEPDANETSPDPPRSLWRDRAAPLAQLFTRSWSIGIVLPAMTCLLVAGLLGDVAMRAQQAWQTRQESQQISSNVTALRQLFDAVTNFRLERGAMNFALVASAPVSGSTQAQIAALRMKSRASLKSALAMLGRDETQASAAQTGSIRQHLLALDVLTAQADIALRQPGEARPGALRTRLASASDDLTQSVDGLIYRLANSTRSPDAVVAILLRVAHNVWLVRSTVGNDRFLFTSAVRSGEPLAQEKLRAFGALAEQIKGRWALVQEDIRPLTAAPQFRKAIEGVERDYFADLPAKRQRITDGLAAGTPIAESLAEWRAQSARAQANMVSVMNIALDLADDEAGNASAEAGKDFVLALMLMGVVSGIGTFTVFYVFQKIVHPIRKITGAMLSVANGELNYEVPFESRSDEIGLLARSLRVFRDNAVETQQLHIAKASAEAANRTKSDFLANMSHELRTPLNAILGYSEIIKNAMFGPLSERYRAYSSDIFNSGTHLLNLINEVLDLSKLEAGQFELYEEDVDPAEIVRAAMQLVEPLAEKAKLGLSLALAGSLPHLRADERRLKQVLINLLSNAVKFTPEGGSVRVSVTLETDSLVIEVRDTGIGMSPDQIPKALQAFRQIDSKISRKHVGTGLGLPLAKHLVELHGGMLVFDSKVNFGTTVRVVLPPERTLPREIPSASTATG
jgi:signal transduction histidine kinase